MFWRLLPLVELYNVIIIDSDLRYGAFIGGVSTTFYLSNNFLDEDSALVKGWFSSENYRTVMKTKSQWAWPSLDHINGSKIWKKKSFTEYLKETGIDSKFISHFPLR